MGFWGVTADDYLYCAFAMALFLLSYFVFSIAFKFWSKK